MAELHTQGMVAFKNAVLSSAIIETKPFVLHPENDAKFELLHQKMMKRMQEKQAEKAKPVVQNQAALYNECIDGILPFCRRLWFRSFVF